MSIGHKNDVSARKKGRTKSWEERGKTNKTIHNMDSKSREESKLNEFILQRGREKEGSSLHSRHRSNVKFGPSRDDWFLYALMILFDGSFFRALKNCTFGDHLNWGG